MVNIYVVIKNNKCNKFHENSIECYSIFIYNFYKDYFQDFSNK
jgi:hypothetical protein